jgi:hypothetical protein
VGVETGRIYESFGFIEKANRASPNDPDVLVSRANILNASGRAEDAETTLRLAMRLDAGFSPAALRALDLAIDALDRIDRVQIRRPARRHRAGRRDRSRTYTTPRDTIRNPASAAS